MPLPYCKILTASSVNEAISRGTKAVNSIHNMTARIPFLMKQSHLESNEGNTLHQEK